MKDIKRFIDSLQQDKETSAETQKEQPEADLVAEIKVVYPGNPKRKEIGFYYNKKEVSWEDMLLADRMHDYPYYFRDGMDYYPFIPEQEPAKKDDIGYDLRRGKGMETHEKSWNTVIMTLEEAIIHCKEKACSNTQCAREHRQLAEWLQELQQYRTKMKELQQKPAEWSLSQLKMFDDILVAIELDKAFTPERVKELVNLLNTCRLRKYSTKPAEWMAGQGWISVDERLPEMDEEVIVLTDELGTAPIYKIAFGHIVDVKRCIDYNGWNIPGVKYWMPCPKIPNND